MTETSAGGWPIWCAVCGEVVYPNCVALGYHDIRGLDDGRARWISLDFNVIVHECDESAGIVAIATEIARAAAASEPSR